MIRKKSIHICLTDEEMEKIKKIADDKYLKVSALIRSEILSKNRKQEEQPQ